MKYRRIVIIFILLELINFIRYRYIINNIKKLEHIKNTLNILNIVNKYSLEEHIHNCIENDGELHETIKFIFRGKKININKYIETCFGTNEIIERNKLYDLLHNKIVNKHKYIDDDKSESIFTPYKDEIEPIYTPFIINLIFYIYHTTKYVRLYPSYKCINTKHVTFYINKNYNEKNPTIIFLHGIGAGITPYLNMLQKLSESYNILAVEIKFISNTIYSLDPFTFEDIEIELENIIKYYKINRVAIISHSYGTVIHSLLLLNNFSKKVNILNNFFIEPVIIPTASHNQLKYIKWFSMYEFIKSLRKNFFSFIMFQPEIQYAIKRFLNAYHTSLCFRTEKKIVVFISVNDSMVKYEETKKWLDECNIKYYSLDSSHGQFVIDDELMHQITDNINQNIVHDIIS